MGAKPLCKLTRIRVKREEENIIKLGGIKGLEMNEMSLQSWFTVTLKDLQLVL